jgi:hypothetical protein
MRRTGAVVIALFLGCGGGGGATGGGGGIASGGSSGAGGVGGSGLSSLSDAAAADANGGTLATPDGNPISPDGPASVVRDAAIPSDTAVAPPDAVAGADAQVTCGQAGIACGATAAACCAGTTCVTFPSLGGDFCTANCVSGDGCQSGCCVSLTTGRFVCAPSGNCATCKKAGETGCATDSDCCAGSACITELSGGVATGTVCKDYCVANAGCYSGCCASVLGATYSVCSATNFCASPAPAPVSSQPAGTFSVTVSRESADLYKVQGKSVWIQTQFCYQYVYYDNATLVWNGKYGANNLITFSSGQTCTVVDILVGQ